MLRAEIPISSSNKIIEMMHDDTTKAQCGWRNPLIRHSGGVFIGISVKSGLYFTEVKDKF